MENLRSLSPCILPPSTPLRDDVFYGAIDLGSSTCRLMITEKKGTSLKTVTLFSRFVRLGEGIAHSPVLTEDAMDRALRALAECTAKLQKNSRPVVLRAVATEAVRRALNKDHFLNLVDTHTGISLDIISKQEEANLVVRGCANLLNTDIPYALIFDIGGASTEIMWAQVFPSQMPKILDWISLPFGVVTVAETHRTDAARDYQLLRQHVMNTLEDFTERNHIPRAVENHKVQILGASGTATTIVAIDQRMHYYDRPKIDGTKLSYNVIMQVIKEVQMMSDTQRNTHRCIGFSRGELVLGGFAILEALCDLWPVGELIVADRGVREGIVTELAFGNDSSMAYQPYESEPMAA